MSTCFVSSYLKTLQFCSFLLFSCLHPEWSNQTASTRLRWPRMIQPHIHQHVGQTNGRFFYTKKHLPNLHENQIMQNLSRSFTKFIKSGRKQTTFDLMLNLQESTDDLEYCSTQVGCWYQVWDIFLCCVLRTEQYFYDVKHWSALTSSLGDEAPVRLSYRHISQPVPPGSLRTEEVSTAGCGLSESLYETETKKRNKCSAESTESQQKDKYRSITESWAPRTTFSMYCEVWQKMSPLCPADWRGTPCRSVRAVAALGRWSPAGSSLRSPRPRLGCPTRPSEPGASTRWSCRTDVMKTYLKKTCM